jgi:protease-4
MGNAAASGGYYVSVNADRIFSDDLTVTGSIGVWASRPNLDSLMKDQKVKVEIFKRGENSDIGSFFRKLNTEDVEIIQGIIDFYYDRFVTAVSEGRNISKDEAEAFAKGRVWLGTDAFSKKLVDEIGGLYQAVVYAKKKSGIDADRFNLVYYAVPGGNTVNDLVTQSIVQYLQSNLLNMFVPDEESSGLEIKY